MKPVKNKRGVIWRQFKMQTKSFKTFYVFMWAIVIATLIYGLVRHQYENVFTCALTLFLFSMPLYIERKIEIDLPDTLIVIIVLFIFCADMLGEMAAFYIRFPWWDTMLHTANGFLAAAVGFSMINILNNSDTVALDMSPLFVAIFAFCFSMTIGVLWEFFEFFMDQFFLTDMQKDTVVHQFATVMLDATRTNTAVPVTGIHDVLVNDTSLGLGGYLDIGIIDTMKDLFVNFIGAVIFSVLGYLYVAHPKAWSFIMEIVPKRMSVQEYNQIYGIKTPPENKN